MRSPCCLCTFATPSKKPEYWSQKRQPLLINASVNISRGNECTRNNRRTVGRGVSSAVLVVSNTQYVDSRVKTWSNTSTVAL
jgi:hypothetical protein